MITFSESDYTFPGCDAQERPPFNVFRTLDCFLQLLRISSLF